MFTKQEDYKGDVQITQSTDITSDFNLILGQTEKKYLRLLLGDELYLLFVEDCTNGVPETQIYKDLLNGKTYQIGNTKFIYDGLKDMLKYFVFSEYKLKYFEDTTIGTTSQQKEDSTKLTPFAITEISNKAYNKGISKYTEAYIFMLQNISNYSTLNNTELKYKFQFTKG